jgi:hypothetical protein
MPLKTHGDWANQQEVVERFSRDRLGFLVFSVRRLMHMEEFMRSGAPAPTERTRFTVPHVRTEVDGADGYVAVRYIYEGLAEDFSTTEKVYEFDPSFDEVPIQAHPNFGGPDGDANTLYKKYGGSYDANGNFRFAPAPQSNGSGGGGLSLGSKDRIQLTGGPGALSSGGNVKSLEGVSSYLRMGGVWRIIYAWREQTLPNIFSGVGTVRVPPDLGRLGNVPPSRNWLKGPPSARWRGNAWEITEEYILSGLGGWVKDIYDGSTEG